ncbi:MAG: orotidine-5'-phosphate decarboxylase [Candidatus Aenigmarchaeota archaeon]|nr:orotidine-5'-phosphate decarboxylase [Candidatus Aenigmarchaeota archaeon]
MKSFSDRLLGEILKKRNPSIIGLDPDMAKMPASLLEYFRDKEKDMFEAAGRCILEFNKRIIDSIHDIVPAVKLQSAFYEQCGPAGFRAFLGTAEYARRKGLIVVGDVKRSDIGNSTMAYSNAYLGKVPLFGSLEPVYDLDAVTVNPYLGSDGIKPFVEDCRKYSKGIFVLVRTSNPSSSELQDLGSGGVTVSEAVARLVNRLGEGMIGESGYSPVGAVVGANRKRLASRLRKAMPRSIFLVPGFGAQGGSAKDAVNFFDERGLGAVIHAARSVIFAYEKSGKGEDYREAARAAAESMRDDIVKAMKGSGKCPWQANSKL